MYRFFNPTFAPFNKKFTKTAYFFLFSIHLYLFATKKKDKYTD